MRCVAIGVAESSKKGSSIGNMESGVALLFWVGMLGRVYVVLGTVEKVMRCHAVVRGLAREDSTIDGMDTVTGWIASLLAQYGQYGRRSRFVFRVSSIMSSTGVTFMLIPQADRSVRQSSMALT